MLNVILFRLLLLACAVIYFRTLVMQELGHWIAEHYRPEDLNQAVRWFSGNPDLWGEYAGSRLRRLEDSELAEAAAAYEQALARNPLDVASWDGLATAHSRLGEPQKAEAALRAYLVATPRSPTAAWRLANFLLVRERAPEALPFLRIAAANDRNLLFPVFDLGWKLLADPQRIFEELVPSDVESRMNYVHFLVWRKGAMVEAYPVWKQIRPLRTQAVLHLGNLYVEALAAAGLGTEAAKVWREVLQDTGRASAKPAGAWITNGDFEAELPNAGLDWRLSKGEGYQIALDNFVFQHGTRSLRVTFDGAGNPDFAAVRQMIPVEPNHSYRFQGHLKMENVTTDNGLFFSLSSLGAPPGETWERTTQNRVGTTPWTLEQAEFRTGPNTRVIQVLLRRRKSAKLNNLIQGKVWIDNLSLGFPMQ